MPAVRSRGRADRGESKPKPRADAYVGLLAISLLALCGAMLFAFLNWNSFPEQQPKPVQMAPRPSAGGQVPGVPPANPAVPPPGMQPPGMQPPGMQPPAVPPGKQPPAPQPPQPKK